MLPGASNDYLINFLKGNLRTVLLTTVSRVYNFDVVPQKEEIGLL